MWGRRIDFNDRNKSAIPKNSGKIHEVEQADTKFAYYKAYKKPLRNFTNYYDNIFRRLKRSKKFSNDRELQSELLPEADQLQEDIEEPVKAILNPKQQAMKQTWFYLNIFGLIFFIIVVTIAIRYSYRNYDDSQQIELGILGR